MSNSARRYVPQSLWVLGWFCLVVAALHWHNPHFWRSAHEVYERAQAAKATGNLEVAANLMKNVLAQERDNLGYLLFDAYVKLDLGRLVQARESFAHALTLAPAHADIFLGMAALRLEQGERAAALEQLNAARSLVANPHERRRLAGLYAQCGDFRAALTILKALWVEPPGERADLVQLLDMAAAAQDWAYIRDLPMTDLLTSTDPLVRTHAIDTRAMALSHLGQQADAYALYRQAPHDGNLLARAQLAQHLGHYAAAADLWAPLIAQNPEQIAWRRSEAYTLLKAGRVAAAEQRYLALLADKAASLGDRVQLAWLFNSQGRYREAWSLLAPLPRPHTELTVLEVQARTAFWAGEMAAAVPLIKALLNHKAEG
jgi:predicted Zn-dependent protease